MTGLVLALAGLTCGDGGPRAGAATARVTAGLDGEWSGTWDNGNGTPPLRVRLRRGVIRFSCDEITIRVTAQPSPGRHAEGVVRAVVDDGRGATAVWGIFEAEPGRLLICIACRPGAPPATFKPVPNSTALITLKPAAQRKP
jgi:hypothetical protein